MKSFKTYITEKKDHLIDKLAITDHQKKELKDFFAKKPNLENKIDWQKKGLAFKDFADIMATTKTERTRMVKKQGIAGLKDGKDYVELKSPADFPFQAYIPLTWEASKLIASNKIGHGTAKWCTAHHKLDKHWYEYAEDNKILIYLIGKDTKIAILLNSGNKIENVYDIKDKKVKVKPKYHTLVDINKSLINKARGIIEKGLEDGVWKDGTWEGGTWTGRLWKNGVWEDGVWAKGRWETGIWDGGTWLGGTWYSGIWRGGTWKGGTWWDGIWNGGTWENGTWDDGIWDDGIWDDGTWFYGIWNGGTWENGTWHKGTWKGGTWKGGNWWAGTWFDGIWENGKWWAGIWSSGIWKLGTWLSGTWKGGDWLGGDWLGGDWLGGTWYGGYDKYGSYHEAGDSPDKWKK